MEKAGLYVHVPFCRGKCPYCDFFSTKRLAQVPRWLRALLKEASFHKGRFGSFDTLYLGGGTPSLLGMEQLERLVHALHAIFPFASHAERTMEINPEDVTREMLRALRGLGFNRVSLGVQSLEEADLRFLGRRHGVSHCFTALEMIREAGFTNLSVDLMYGLPTQSAMAWARVLERLLDFSPEHISCYQLTVKPNTPFAVRMAEGRLRPLPEDVLVDLYNLACERIEAAGYDHYEVSNFARGDVFRSTHNSGYWHHQPYLGLGPSAHSFDGRSRWWNVRNLEDYCRAVTRGQPPVEGREVLSPEQFHMERLLLGFRTREGVPSSLVADCRNAPSILRDLQQAGLITTRANNLQPSRSGLLVADSLPLLFLGA